MRPSIYLVLGTPSNERCTIIYDLIDGSSHEELSSLISISEHDAIAEWEELVEKAEKTTLSIRKKGAETENFSSVDRVFYITNPYEDLAEATENAQKIFEKNNLQVSRVLGFIDAHLAHQEDKELWPYYEALAHFSDYLLIINSRDIDNTWMQHFIKRFEKAGFPCIVEKVKKLQVENPMLVLDNQEKRITQIFDDYDALDEIEFNEEELADEPFEIEKQPDIYLERNEQGDRVRPLPEIKKYLN